MNDSIKPQTLKLLLIFSAVALGSCPIQSGIVKLLIPYYSDILSPKTWVGSVNVIQAAQPQYSKVSIEHDIPDGVTSHFNELIEHDSQ